MYVVIFVHNRGFNKLNYFVKGLTDLGYRVSIITDFVYESQVNRFQLNDAEIIVDESFSKFEIGKPDWIFCLNENLLPVQASIDEDLSLTASNVLVHKNLFNDYCRKIGLGEYIPKSVVPYQPSDLDLFSGSFYIKPTVGTGTKREGKYEKLMYYGFECKSDFLLFLRQNGLDDFFSDNYQSMTRPNFNNVPFRFMAEEYLEGEDTISPYVYIDNESKPNLLWWSKNEIKRFSERGLRFEDQIWKIYSQEVVDERGEMIMDFHTRFAKELGIKNMIFSGPDMYKNGKIIDINPRPGNGMAIASSFNKDLWRMIIEEKRCELKNHYLWTAESYVTDPAVRPIYRLNS